MGASLHDLDAAGQTALHYAVSNYGQASAEITEFLVAAGCDVNARQVMFVDLDIIYQIISFFSLSIFMSLGNAHI